MKEKIREMARQAGFHIDVSAGDNGMFKFEHFAELIALECISIIQSQQGNHCQFDDWDYGYDAALDKTENDVRQFFGV